MPVKNTEVQNKKPKVSDELKQRLETIEKSLWVTRVNGKTETIHISKLVLEDHERLKTVESNTAILADFNKVHSIFKKYKIYWVVAILLLAWYSGWNFAAILTKIIFKI